MGAASSISEIMSSEGTPEDHMAKMLALDEFKSIDAKYHDTLKKAYSVFKTNPDNLSVKCFDPTYFMSLDDALKDRLLKCMNSGLENPDSGLGVYAMQPNDYDELAPFFNKVLKDYHKITTDDFAHVSDWTLGDDPLDLAKLGLPELSMRVRVGRNLKAYPLPGAMSADDRKALELKMGEAFKILIANPDFGGRYHSLTEGHPDFVDKEAYDKLVTDHFMFKDMGADSYLTAAGIASDWPVGRGCFKSADEKFVVWVGEEDHLRIMCMFKGTKLTDVFNKLNNALEVVNGIEGLEFAFSDKCGNVTSCPSNLGTGMRASVHIQLPKLTSDGSDAKAKEICKPLGLSVRGLGGEHTAIGADGTVDISPSARFCIKESEIVTALYNGLKDLKAAEDAAGAS